MSTLNVPKTERIDVRVSTPVKQLLQEATRASKKNVTASLIDAGTTASDHTLADRRHFTLKKTQWQESQAALASPIQSKPVPKPLLPEPGVTA